MQHNISGANKKHDYYFSGMCVCNDCGSGMSGIIIKRKVKEKGYDCSRYRQYSTKACHCHEIKEKDILIHLKEFFKFTKQKYLKEIKDIKIEIKQENKTSDKFKLQNKLNILNEEYKMLINQKILKTSVEYFDEIINASKPNRIILQMIIDKIYIHRDKTIRFSLKADIEKLLK